MSKLKLELGGVKREIDNFRFDIEQFRNKPKDIAFYTVFSDYETLMLCYAIVKEPAKDLNYGSFERKTCNTQQGSLRKLFIYQEFILFPVKLRLVLFNRNLAYRFKVSKTVVSEIFRTCIRFLRYELEVLIQLPPRIHLNMPSLLIEFYPKTAIVIYCTEIEMERPSALDNQSAGYSSYKLRTTMKALVGTTPNAWCYSICE